MNNDSELEWWARQWRAEIEQASLEAQTGPRYYRPVVSRWTLRFAIITLACLAAAWEIWAEHSVPGATDWLLVSASFVLSWVQEQVTGASAGEPGQEYAVVLVRSSWMLVSISLLGMVASLCAIYLCVGEIWFGTWPPFVVRSSMLLFAVGCFVLSVKRARENVRLLHGMHILRPRASARSTKDSRLAEGGMTSPQSRFVGRRQKYKKRRGAM